MRPLILNFYIFRRTALLIAIVVLAIGGLLLVMNVADEISRRGGEGFTPRDALIHELYGMPLYLYQFIGPMVLLGTLLSVAGMAKNSELVIIQLASRSAIGLVLRLLLPGLILLAPVFYIGEWVGPQLRLQGETMRAEKLDRGRPTLSGEWYRDNQWVINAEFISQDQKITGLALFELDQRNTLSSVTFAQSATPDANGWRLRNVTTITFNEQLTARAKTPEKQWTPDNFHGDLVRILSQRPWELTLSQLGRQVAFTEQQNQPNPELSLRFWSRVWQPVQYTGMLILALVFAVGSYRQRTLGEAAFKGVAVAIAVQLVSDTGSNLLMVTGVLPMFAALAPAAVFLPLTLWLLHRKL